jgi:maltooligosyltrehalose trehalohydrolase
VHDIPGAGRRLLGYAQTHDQVGNRARGERLSHLCGVRLAKIGAAVTFLAPFVPMLFQGEEWATKSPFQYFTDHESPELQKAVREGRRAEFAAFGWAPEDVPDPQDPATFARSKLGWDELGEELHAGVFAWYRMLASLRANEPALRDGRLENVEVRQADHWLEMTRGNVTLVVNFGGGWVERGKPPGKMVLASEPTIVDAEPLRMAPESAAIWLT